MPERRRSRVCGARQGATGAEPRVRLSILGDDDFLPGANALEELRQMRLRLVDVDGLHEVSLVHFGAPSSSVVQIGPRICRLRLLLDQHPIFHEAPAFQISGCPGSGAHSAPNAIEGELWRQPSAVPPWLAAGLADAPDNRERRTLNLVSLSGYKSVMKKWRLNLSK